MDIINELNILKDKLDKAKITEARYKERLENLEEERKNILKELEDLGFKPENLEVEIDKLKKYIESSIEEIKGSIPEEIINEHK